MQKAKFKIKGMHCKSCALLIEMKLKELNGVISAKVNLDSKKAVVMYDEDKVEKGDFIRAVREAGDYQLMTEGEDSDDEEAEEEEPVEKERDDGAEEDDDEEERHHPQNSNIYDRPPRNEKYSNNTSFVLGMLISFSVVSLILNIVLGVNLAKAKSGQSSDNNTNTNTVAQVNTNTAPSNPTAQPTPTQPAQTVQTFNITKDDHIRGDFNAKVTLVEYSDFECPYCEKHYPTLKKILSDYGKDVRLVYKQYPLSFHPNAQKAAESSECASEQGKFWEYHDKLFENQPTGYSLDKFKQWATDLGLNSSKFNDCLDTGKYAQKVQADQAEGTSKGVNGTPATFVNGQLISGAVPYETFKQAVDSLL